MNPRLLLVDGHNLLFRMFFGMPDNFYSARRIKFNAVYGFATALADIIGNAIQGGCSVIAGTLIFNILY